MKKTPGGTEVVSTAGECYGECPSSIYTGWILQGFVGRIGHPIGVMNLPVFWGGQKSNNATVW